VTFVRNAHPTKRLALPFGDDGWARLLYPGVTTSVPERALHTPLVRLLLTEKLIELTNGAAWDPDARQRRAARTDMARAIAAAEQAEFTRLMAGLQRRQGPQRPRRQPRPRRPRKDEWSEDQVAQLRRCHAAGMTCSAIAVELGRTRGSVIGKALREGLRRSPCA
jgi:hypothetical protein